jgi:hypothetical protein
MSDQENDPDSSIEEEFSQLVEDLLDLRTSERNAARGARIGFLVTKVLNYKIEIRPKEEGHNHPHFHVCCPDYDGSYRIDDASCLAGHVPRRHEKVIQAWATKNRELLEKEWKRAHPWSFEEKRTVIE